MSYLTRMAIQAGFEPAFAAPLRCRRVEAGAGYWTWRCRRGSNSLVSVLQTAAFPFRHRIILAREARIERATARFRAECTPDCATPESWSGHGVPPTGLRSPSAVLFLHELCPVNGQDGRLRSCGLWSPGPALFRAELRPVVSAALLEHAVSSCQGKRIAGFSCALSKWRFREDLNPYHLRS